MLNRINNQDGLVKTIIVIVVALLILSYLGFNLRGLIESPTTQSKTPSGIKGLPLRRVWRHDHRHVDGLNLTADSGLATASGMALDTACDESAANRSNQ